MRWKRSPPRRTSILSAWVWLALLGLVLPIALLILGWNAGKA